MTLKLDTLTAIRDSQGLSPQEKLVLWTVYSRGSKHTGSMNTLATNMGYQDSRQTRRIVKGLKERGILDVTEHTGGTHTITINTLVLQTLVAEDRGVVQDKGGMSSKTRGGSLPRPPKENTKDKEKEKKGGGSAAGSTSSSKDREGSLIEKKNKGASPINREEEGLSPIQPVHRGPAAPGPNVDYAALAREQGIKHKYDGYLNVFAKDPNRDAKAYKMACKALQRA